MYVPNGAVFLAVAAKEISPPTSEVRGREMMVGLKVGRKAFEAFGSRWRANGVSSCYFGFGMVQHAVLCSHPEWTHCTRRALLCRET
jgi:hypothetical protein